MKKMIGIILLIFSSMYLHAMEDDGQNTKCDKCKIPMSRCLQIRSFLTKIPALPGSLNSDGLTELQRQVYFRHAGVTLSVANKITPEIYKEIMAVSLQTLVTDADNKKEAEIPETGETHELSVNTSSVAASNLQQAHSPHTRYSPRSQDNNKKKSWLWWLPCK